MSPSPSVRSADGRPAAARARGAALLLVLWLIALLTSLVGAFALSAQVEGLQGRVLVRGLAAGNAARAGVEYALTRLENPDPQQQWLPDGRTYTWRYADAEIQVEIIDEAGKLDLNNAQMPLLTALLRTQEVDQGSAGRLAGAIVDWRDPDLLTQASGGAEDHDYASAGRSYGAKDAPFESVAELQQVLGITPELYERIQPLVTVYSRMQQPDPAFAPAPVLDAMGMDGAGLVERRRRTDPVTGLSPDAGGMANRSGTYSIHSRARLFDGRESALRVVVNSGGNAVPGIAYTALHWKEGVSAQ